MLPFWWFTALLTQSPMPALRHDEAGWPQLVMAESARGSDAGTLRLTRRLSFDETRGPERLGLAGGPTQPGTSSLAVAGIDLLLREQVGAVDFTTSLGALAGCPVVARTLARQCVGDVCLGNEETLTSICDEVVSGALVALAGGAADLVADGAILGGS